MKIVVLNGSPKGETSVTMQYVHYVQKAFPQHTLEIVHIAQRLKKIERDPALFQEILDRVRAADGVLWAFPLYFLLVHAHYKRFIELIWERGAQDAFRGKYAASLSTSIHFFDHTAHNYIQGICDDLGMPYVGAFAADMPDLLEAKGRRQLTLFAEGFFAAIERQTPLPRSSMPLQPRRFAYTPAPVSRQLPTDGRKVVVVTDARPGQDNIQRMVEHFAAALDGVKVINLHDLDIKGGCLGCLRCGYNYECAYTGRDGYIDFYNQEVKTADILVFAATIQDRYLSATWKNYFDRSFFNTHTPTLTGKQVAFVISGPLSQLPNLREILDAYTQFQQANLVGFVTDEYGDSAALDALLEGLAERLVESAGRGYIQPQNFLGVAGAKLFRDDIWGRLRPIFQADHRAYRRMGFYDFPQRDLGLWVRSAFLTLLLRIGPIRRVFTPRIRAGMIAPYQKVLREE